MLNTEKHVMTAMASMAVYSQRGYVAAMVYMERCGYCKEEATHLLSLWDNYVEQVKTLCPTTKMH
jgi:hypothetical protein